jgi:AcrR family transcriptional regulator
MPERAPTRQRLLDAGVELFAAQGFHATSVGDIEAAVGLQPRRGALYKHFASKRALLDAAVRAYLDSAATGAAQVVALGEEGALSTDPALLRPLVIALGRWFLDEMDRLENLTRIVEHDGQRLGRLTTELRTRMVDLSYQSTTVLIRAVAPDVADPEALCVILLGSLVALRRTAWTFGAPPVGIDDDRALEALADLTLAALRVS